MTERGLLMRNLVQPGREPFRKLVGWLLESIRCCAEGFPCPSSFILLVREGSASSCILEEQTKAQRTDLPTLVSVRARLDF